MAWANYQWRQERRVTRIHAWVNDYLRSRFGEMPARLNILCSHDGLWPVLVRIDTPGTGIRHSVQFTCPGRESEWMFLSEKDEER